MGEITKNPWHDLNSSIASMKLGFSLLREELKSQVQINSEVEDILKKIDGKIDQSIEQVSALRKRFGDN